MDWSGFMVKPPCSTQYRCFRAETTLEGRRCQSTGRFTDPGSNPGRVIGVTFIESTSKSEGRRVCSEVASARDLRIRPERVRRFRMLRAHQGHQHKEQQTKH